jgi:hypothetical protein
MAYLDKPIDVHLFNKFSAFYPFKAEGAEG